MEYIEPKPVEPKPHAKRNKIILWSSIAAVAIAAVSVTYYFLITKVFIEKENIDLLTFSYRYDEEGEGVRIDAVKEGVKLPAHFRIPNKLEGRPVVEIAPEVFMTNTDIVEMIFPDSLKIIGNNCFSDCSNLEKFNVPASLKTVGTDAFSNTKWLDQHDDGEVSIGKMLYTYKGELEYPSCIVSSEESSEYDKPEYKTVINLGKYNEMTSGVFKDQKGLKYAEIPEQFSVINESLFEGCTNLEKVVLHEKIDSIEANAFTNCTSLSGFLLPTSVTYIGNEAFKNTIIPGPIYLPENIEYFGYGVFQGDSELTDVHFPYGYSYVPDYSFEGCSKLTGVYFSDREFTSESRLSYIGTSAFKGTGLKTFATPYNVVTVRAEAFSECKDLETYYIYNNTTATYMNVFEYNSETGEYQWAKSKTEFQGILKFESGVFADSNKFKSMVLVDVNNTPITPLGEVHIPLTLANLGNSREDTVFFYNTAIEVLDLTKDTSMIENENYRLYLEQHPLEVVESTLCKNAKSLHTVKFTDTITSIYSAAFYGCTSLKNIAMSDDIIVVGSNIFENCDNLENVILAKNGTTISAKMFSGCVSLETINVPSGYTTIGSSAFANCVALKNVNYEGEGNITNIGQEAFIGCTSLENIVIPNTCDALATAIFKDCTSLKNVTLSNNKILTTLKAETFANCTSLKTVTLPQNFKVIDKNAFKDSGIEDLTLEYNEGVVTLDTTAFDGCSLKNIYVPSELVDQYKADNTWKALALIIKPIA